MKRLLFVPLLVAAALTLWATAALGAVSPGIYPATINAANGPTGTHFAGKTSATCTVSGLTVTCSSYQLAGVGNANAQADLTANYTATVDCFNPGTNPNNPIESHTTSFSDNPTTGQLSPKNGKLTVPSLSSSPSGGLPAATSCPNPNWDPKIRPGTLQLASFTYTLNFAGFAPSYITISAP
jgi:hypothetical protein